MTFNNTYDDTEKLIEDSSSADLDDVSEFEISESDDSSNEDFLETISSSDENGELSNDVDCTPINESSDFLLLSRAGFEWSTRPRVHTKSRVHNFVTAPPGIIGDAKNVATIIEAFEIFISNNIVDDLLKYTNKYRETKGLMDEKITIQELKAFIGVLIASGRSNGRSLALRNVWDTNPLFKQFYFSSAISRDRFIHINQMLRFDDKSTRASVSRKQTTSWNRFGKLFRYLIIIACKIIHQGHILPLTNVYLV